MPTTITTTGAELSYFTVSVAEAENSESPSVINEEEVIDLEDDNLYYKPRLIYRNNHSTGEGETVDYTVGLNHPEYNGYNIDSQATDLNGTIVNVKDCYVLIDYGLFLKKHSIYDKFAGLYFPDPSIYSSFAKHSKIMNIYQDFDGKNFINCDYAFSIFYNYGANEFITDRFSKRYIVVDKNYVNVRVLKNPSFYDLYIEDLKTGNFISKDKYVEFKKGKTIRGIEYKTPFDTFLKFNKNKPNTYIKTLNKQYRFGVEIETISGILPKYLTNDIFYSSVYDGSLKHPNGEVYGYEYVTDILKGDSGLKQLKMLCYEITKRCMIDRKCSVHTHISDINFNKENVVLLYFLCLTLENEIFSSLPPSRKNNEYCRRMKLVNIDITKIVENRDYYIDFYYSEIIKILSTKGTSDKHINKKKQHPKGNKCGYDHSTERYCWVNFIPSVFNTRHNEQYSIEFRCLGGTANYYSIKNWLLICMAIVNFVEDYKKSIYYGTEPITIENILKIVYYNKYQEVLNWFNEQVYRFSKDNIESDMAEDNNFNLQITDNNFSIKSL